MTHEFNPDWTLSPQDQLRVKLTLALAKHVPDWPGCTDEQLDAVAAEMTTITDNPEKSPNADISDHEAKAREIADRIVAETTHELRGKTEAGTFHLVHSIPSISKFRAAIVSALREAEAGERREIMNLLGYDENGDGLTSTSEWIVAKYDPDASTSGDEQSKREVTICHDPYYNLEGALIDLRRQGADKVCISTIEKVQAQLAAVSKRAAAIRSRNDE